ncbi:hypothetical protein RKE30_13370 [Streptomyces sp. Li-HN-5-11]|uniref:hypothetical protein n=1 Tax=Streptomyces sp. Li-HN-5-11 TaxID=3075432 RepID=UPI0028A609E7|nr:hypothetical protein [Streptomyces sp. Li-HN-5-11]WNM31323.1 hypothetical protein RKE30_13370 [Streptomyces sp. Li-HN-5-11]
MAVDQLPGRIREFVGFLDDLLARLDQGGGWCGVFWQRDPEGMRACLDGREIPPWDVVEALVQDLAAAYGPEAAAPHGERARALYTAAVTAYDARPGSRDALGDRLDVLLREQRYAAERQAALTRRLASAAGLEESDALRVDLAWARDDHQRATARCAEILARMEALDARDRRGTRGGAPAGPQATPASGTVLRAGGEGTGFPAQAGQAGGPTLPRDPGDEVEAADWSAFDDGSGAALSGARRVAGGAVPGRAGWNGGRTAAGASRTGRQAPDATPGRHVPAAGHPADHHPDSTAAVRQGITGPSGHAFGPDARVGAAGGFAATGRPVHGAPAPTAGPGPDAPSPADPLTRPSPADPLTHAGRPADHPDPAAPVVPGTGTSGHVFGPDVLVGATGGFVATGAAGRPAHGAPPATAGRGPDAPSLADPLTRAEDRAAATSLHAAAAPATPAQGAPAPAPTTPVHDAAAPAPAPASKPRRRRRGSARFAGMAEEEAAPAVVPPGAVAVPDAPAPAAGRTPRGARFAGAAVESVERTRETSPVDADDARAVARTVEALVRLRGAGRSGEAHALLAEASHWQAGRLPLLAAELEGAGLGADWTTLLWEAAALPADRLVAAADALTAAGRADDGRQIVRQGVARPGAEIGEAVLGLVAEGRHREVRVLLDAYVRVRTPEQAALSAEPDPGRLVPLLLEAARGVSDERHWDLLHALRVAGFAT